MVKIMTKASNKKPKTGYWTKMFTPARVKQTAEHHLSNREGMSPVMVCNFLSVVLLHCQDPAAHCFVIQAELLHQVKVMEHSQ